LDVPEDETGNTNRRRVRAVPVAQTPPRPARPPLALRLRGAVSALVARAKGPVLGTLRATAALALVASTVALYRVVDRWVRTAPEFALTAIDVEGLERLDEEEIRAVAGAHLGDNVFSRAPEEMAAALREHPWIAEARVVRRLPGTVRIEIREHHAVALLLQGGAYLVSSEGLVIKAVEPGDPVDLPVITGVDRTRFVGDLGFRTQLLATVVALLAEYEDMGLNRRARLAEVHVERGDELTLFVGDEATEVRLGRGTYRPKLDRFVRVLDELRREEAHAAYVLLDNVRRPDRVTVRLR
jgi:cell division protein FtsQ